MHHAISSNRRTSVRTLEPGGSALCQSESDSRRYPISDASSAGVALSGPKMALGTNIDLKIWWPMIGTATARGIVCRHDADRERFAIRYTHGDGVEILIRDLIAIENLRRTQPKPLFCGSSAAIRRAMDDLSTAGFAYEHANTHLDAFNQLVDPRQAVTAIVIPPTMHWLEFSAFIGTEYQPSHLRRILVADMDSHVDEQLAMDHHIADESLRMPWHPQGLYAALGLRTGEETCLSCQSPLAVALLAYCQTCRSRSYGRSEVDDLGDGD